MKMSAAEFKAKCLKVMDAVNERHEEVVVTKHGKPVVKVVPVSQEPSRSLFGFKKNSVKIHGDITQPVGETWQADS